MVLGGGPGALAGTEFIYNEEVSDVCHAVSTSVEVAYVVTLAASGGRVWKQESCNTGGFPGS